jgi:hypothetical protein
MLTMPLLLRSGVGPSSGMRRWPTGVAPGEPLSKPRCGFQWHAQQARQAAGGYRTALTPDLCGIRRHRIWRVPCGAKLLTTPAKGWCHGSRVQTTTR